MLRIFSRARDMVGPLGKSKSEMRISKSETDSKREIPGSKQRRAANHDASSFGILDIWNSDLFRLSRFVLRIFRAGA
jgi:hypothetical protein